MSTSDSGWTEKQETHGIASQTHRPILLRPIGPLGPWIDDAEPSDGLVGLFLVIAGLNLDQFFGSVGGKEAPSLVPGNEGVPGGGA